MSKGFFEQALAEGGTELDSRQQLVIEFADKMLARMEQKQDKKSADVEAEMQHILKHDRGELMARSIKNMSSAIIDYADGNFRHSNFIDTANFAMMARYQFESDDDATVVDE